MKQNEQWASRLGLVLAMAGNAVGLGNFLRFPATAARNGGGAFLIPYIVAFLVMGLPLMWVEWTMGRYGGQFGHHSTPGVFQSMGKGRQWKYFGTIGLWTCLVIAAYYLYIETWCLAYAFNSAIGGFKGMTPEKVEGFFNSLTGTKPNQILAISGWGMGLFALCIGLNVYVLSRGLSKGIEVVAKVGMPLLILFGLILAIRGLFIDPSTDKHAIESPLVGLNWMWEPKLTSLGDPSVWLAAAGQIFFTLSIGMGSCHCYASYLRSKDDVALNGATTAWTNEFCEVILGGLILLPIAVAYLGLPAVQEKVAGGSGFGLGFFVFPTLFNNWGALAPAAGFMWFGLLFFAAITSSLAMGQPLMAFFQTEYKMTREKSALAFAGILVALAIPVAIFNQVTFFDEFDYWAANVGLVVFALAEAILFGWVFGMARGWAELNTGADLKVPKIFYPILKYVTPVFLAVILTTSIFKPEGKVAVMVDGKARTEEKGWEPYIRSVFGGPPAPAWQWAGSGLIGKLLHRDLAPPQAGSEKAVVDFYENTKTVRNIDRLVMIGVFVFLASLVGVAWSKRRKEGRADS